MSVETVKGERRCHLRWRVWGVHGRIAPDHEVSLLDISQGGGLIEHAHPVRPGTILFVTLSNHEQQTSVKCRVVRSVTQRYEVWPTGEQEHFYRTGLEFLVLSENSQWLINEIIVAAIGGR
ncbi:MAG: hypothetical protein GTO40_13960 [Deltaproteobacteria bacterium]|nr:hypothetical protein [Deltaproteobacteria bacterium]